MISLLVLSAMFQIVRNIGDSVVPILNGNPGIHKNVAEGQILDVDQFPSRGRDPAGVCYFSMNSLDRINTS